MSMTLGRRIGWGFGVVVAITIVLGAIGSFSMNRVTRESKKLSDEYVPEVAVVGRLRADASRLMLAMRGYGLSEEAKYFEAAKQAENSLNASLAAASDLAAKAKHLKVLQEHVAEAQRAADRYEQLINETEKAVKTLAEQRHALAQNADAYVANCATFLDIQNKTFIEELDARQTKIQVADAIQDLGAKVREVNFRGQAERSPELLDAALAELTKLKPLTDTLRPVTTKAEDIRRIDEIEQAAGEYGKAMGAYAAALRTVIESRAKIDKAAADYRRNGHAFLDEQNKLMKDELATPGADLSRRLATITRINDVINQGNALRAATLAGQAQLDAAVIRDALGVFTKTNQLLTQIRQQTKESAQLAMLDQMGRGATNYSASIEACLAGMEKMAGLQQLTDTAASVYVANCESYLAGQQQKLASELRERHLKITMVNGILDLGNEVHVNAYKAQATRNPALMETARGNFTRIEQNLTALREITRQAANLQQIANIHTAGENYNRLLGEFLATWQGLQQIGEQQAEAGQALLDICTQTADANFRETGEIASTAAASLGRSSRVMVIGLLLGVLIATGLALLITRGITGLLSRIIRGMQQGSEQVTAASGEVSSASQEMAEGSSEQASSLEETSASLEEMASMTRQNADNATQANVAMTEAQELVRNGVHATSTMVATIGKIKESSEQTAKIIKTIDEIAFQTNLLALNAAVEAARAGEAGKGFAVVAEEVRNLAQRSAEAAKNTAALIEGAQANADAGVNVVSAAAENLKGIEAGVRKVASLVAEIAAASKEQAQGIDQVNTAVGEMDKVVQQNAANAEESASAAEELSAQARELNTMIADLAALAGRTAARTGVKALGNARVQKALAAGSAPTGKPGSEHVLRTHIHDMLAEHKKKAAQPQPARAGTKEKARVKSVAKPEEVIPLDSETFSDF